jgi:diguanylate cyclase (GGDEF)-like protein/PAS domain S-box-containing protein
MLMRQGRRLKAAVSQVRESEARLHTVADNIPAMVAYIDAEQRHRFHNAAYARYIGPNSEEALGKTVLEVVGEERYRFFQPFILRALAGEALEFQQESEEGGVYRCLESHYIPQFAEESQEVLGFHVMRQDITSKKLEEMRLQQLAQVDALTGLCNRAGFQLRLQDAMQRSRHNHSLLAILYLDIDHFKPVNDTHGHKVGDALLKAFSQRLLGVFRAGDTVARLGGDEFTVIMENLQSRADAKFLAGKVVAAMQPIFEVEASGGDISLVIEVQVSASVGLAFYQGEGQNAEELIHEADMMLYQAKRGGRNRYVESEA